MIEAEKRIREALAMGPTPGPWELKDGRTDTVENAQGYPVCTVHWHPDERYGHGVRAAYITACSPENIAALLAEIDRLRAAIDMQPSPPTHEDMEWADKVFLAKAEKENDALRAEVEALRAQEAAR